MMIEELAPLPVTLIDGAGSRDNEFDLLYRFAPISLVQMEGVSLSDRIDTKYVMAEWQLYEALAALTNDYWVLEVDGHRLSRYRSLYFDTPDFAFYRDHHAGRRNRYKVRSREYVDSTLSFLEIKLKRGQNRTLKHRIRTTGLVTRLTSTAGDFVREHVARDTEQLEPRLWNEFSRITLVSRVRRERVTLDLNLRFYSEDHGVALPGLVVAEVKEERSTRASTFAQVMHELHIRSSSFSKYCVGVTLVYPETKQNNFKPTHRLLTKVLQGAFPHAC